MPRYFINAPEGFHAHDEGGLELPDTAALATVLRQLLAATLHDEAREAGQAEFLAERATPTAAA